MNRPLTVCTHDRAADLPDDQTLTQTLADFGIRHESGPNGSRYLYDGTECIGIADATQGWHLVKVLRRARATLLDAASAHVTARDVLEGANINGLSSDDPRFAAVRSTLDDLRAAVAAAEGRS